MTELSSKVVEDIDVELEWLYIRTCLQASDSIKGALHEVELAQCLCNGEAVEPEEG